MILCQLEVKIEPKLDFHGGIFFKLAETRIAPRLFSDIATNHGK